MKQPDKRFPFPLHLPADGIFLAGQPPEAAKLEGFAVRLVKRDLRRDLRPLHGRKLVEIELITEYAEEAHVPARGQGRGAQGLRMR